MTTPDPVPRRSLDRRAFLGGGSAALAALAGGSLGAGVGFARPGAARSENTTPGGRRIRKTLKFGMVPGGLPVEERLRIARDAGFESVEPDTMFDPAEVKALRAAADKVGIHLDAIVCSKHWSHPLSDPDPAVVETCMEAMRVSIRNAKEMGGDMVLLVPAVVTPKVRYREAWERSVARVRELIPEAEKHGVVIGLENVWNKFHLSPMEAAAYVDEIGHPSVRYWLDVGNMVLFGYPQDWIRELGRERIARVDVKDFDSKKREFVELRKGSVDWPEVMRAFDEIGYEGWFAAEVRGGDQDYLTEAVSRPMDEIIAGR